MFALCTELLLYGICSNLSGPQGRSIGEGKYDIALQSVILEVFVWQIEKDQVLCYSTSFSYKS